LRIVQRIERRDLELGREPRALLGGDDRELRQGAIAFVESDGQVGKIVVRV